MGKFFLGKVWGKKRPMLQIEKDKVIYHAGISHTFKKGMIPLTKDDVKEDCKFPLDDDTYAGLSNKSEFCEKLGELGETKEEFDEKLLEANSKLSNKIKNRT
jgi:hypothetical protein